MTVIAWDGRILAVDSQRNSGNHKSAATKIHMIDNKVLACCGSVKDIYAALDYFTEWTPEKEKPQINNFGAIMLMNGEAYFIEESLFEFPIESDYAAMGTGEPYAVMALHLRYSAKDAVRYTCQLASDCGGPIQFYDTQGDGRLQLYTPPVPKLVGSPRFVR